MGNFMLGLGLKGGGWEELLCCWWGVPQGTALGDENNRGGRKGGKRGEYGLLSFLFFFRYNLLFPTPQISAPGLFMPAPTIPSDDGSWPMISDEAFLRVFSASVSMRWTSSAQEGMSWIRPMTCPAVQT